MSLMAFGEVSLRSASSTGLAFSSVQGYWTTASSDTHRSDKRFMALLEIALKGLGPLEIQAKLTAGD